MLVYASWEVHGATELRVSKWRHSTPPSVGQWGCCELRLRSAPRYLLWFAAWPSIISIICFCFYNLQYIYTVISGNTVVAGGPGIELCVFVVGWRHALQCEWPFTIIISAGSTISY